MIRLMTHADIPAAMRLKESAGWNQTAHDWENLLAIEPEGCWVYEALETPGNSKSIVGSATIVCYGRVLAWIGMVLVLPEFRRQGIARQLMQHALRYAGQRGVARVALDATSMGEPLYRDLGFEADMAIERWEGVAPVAADSGEDAERPQAATEMRLDQLAHLDERAFGADRRILLERLILSAAPTDCWTARGGYLLARPGSNAYFLGPCVAEEPPVARRLLQALFTTHRSRRFFWDLLPENNAARDLAASFGFRCARSLTRMSRPAASLAAPPRIAWQYAAAGFEYG